MINGWTKQSDYHSFRDVFLHGGREGGIRSRRAAQDEKTTTARTNDTTNECTVTQSNKTALTRSETVKELLLIALCSSKLVGSCVRVSRVAFCEFGLGQYTRDSKWLVLGLSMQARRERCLNGKEDQNEHKRPSRAFYLALRAANDLESVETL
jgi:hypothetical protein